MTFHVNCLLVDDSYEISRYIFFLKFKQHVTKAYSAFCHDRRFKDEIKAVLISKPFQAPDKRFFDPDLI